MPEQYYPPASGFVGRGQIDVPTLHYVSDEETLQLQVYSRTVQTTVVFTGRVWSREEGRIKHFREELSVPSGSFPFTYRTKLAAGALLNARVVAVDHATLQFGQLFGRVELIHGTTGALHGLAVLLQGYFDADNQLAWPGTPLQTMHDSRGVIYDAGWQTQVGPLRLLTLVPTNARWRVVCGACQFTASGVAGNRFLVFALFDAFGTLIWRAITPDAITAGITALVAFGAGVPTQSIIAPTRQNLGFPVDVELEADSEIRVQVSGEQAGDAFTPEGIIIREWMST